MTALSRISAAAIVLASAAIVGFSSPSPASPAEPLDTKDGGAPDAGVTCVKYWGEARSTGLGYRHVVVLSSGCKKPAICDVSTDVNPEVQKVSIAPNGLEEVVTFLESPASAFTPKVECKLK